MAVAPCARGAEPLPFGLAAGLGGVEAESRTTGGPNRAPVPGASHCLRPSPVPFFSGSFLGNTIFFLGIVSREHGSGLSAKNSAVAFQPKIGSGLFSRDRFSGTRQWPFSQKFGSGLSAKNRQWPFSQKLQSFRGIKGPELAADLVEAADFLELELVTLRASSLL
jgi:hypothetical protein